YKQYFEEQGRRGGDRGADLCPMFPGGRSRLRNPLRSSVSSSDVGGKMMSKSHRGMLILAASCISSVACVVSPEEEPEHTDSTTQAHSNWCAPPNPPGT